MRLLHLRITCALFLLCFAAGAFGETIVFGPRTYTRNAGAPQTFAETFAIDPQWCGGKAAFIMTIDNGAQDTAVDSGEISLNGTVLMSQSDFQQGRGTRQALVHLGSSNMVSVTLNGGHPGSAVTLSIRREIHEDLVAPQTYTAVSTQNTFTQSIHLPDALPSAAIVVRLGNSPPDSFAMRLNGSEILNNKSLAGSLAMAYVSLQANNTIEINVKGRAGDTIDVGVKRLSDESACGPFIEIDSLPPDAVVSSASVAVVGKVMAQTRDIGVTVNGRVADVDLWHAGTANDPFRFVTMIDAVAGPLVLEAVASDTTGGRATATRSVTVSQAQPFELRPDVNHGIAPFTASFSVVTDTPERMQSFDVDYDGDGTYDTSNVTSFETPLTYNYAAPGIYPARLRIRDVDGATFIATAYVTVQHPAAIDAAVQARWKQLHDALAAQDVDSAAKLFIDPSKEKYRSVLTTLFTKLPAMAAGMSGAPVAISIHADYVDYLVTRVENGVTVGYHLTLVRDYTGIWEIADF